MPENEENWPTESDDDEVEEDLDDEPDYGGGPDPRVYEPPAADV